MKKPSHKSRPARPLFNATSLPETGNSGAVPDAVCQDFGRPDGWTPERRKRFLELFGLCGIVTKAAEAVGLSRRAAYDLRNRDPEFALAWDAARHVSRQVVIDEAVSTAFDGRRTRIYEKGVQVGERLHNSASIVYSLVKKIRSKKLIGNPVVIAASRHFYRCMTLLEQGIAFPDPETGIEETGIESAPVLCAPAGWTPAEQVAFCRVLEDCGSVAKACDAIGKPRSSAYAARHHAGGAAFAIAWDAALFVATEHLLDLAMDLTCEGAITITVKQGKEPFKKRIIDPKGRAKAGEWLDAILPPLEAIKPNPVPKRERALGRTFDRIGSGEAQAETEVADVAQAASGD